MDDGIFERTPPVDVASPCILVCTLDLATGWCLGCGRTGEEIAGWTRDGPERRRSILDALPARLAKLSRDR